MRTRLVPIPKTNTCLESSSLVLATCRYFAGEGGYNYIVLYNSDIGAADCALSLSCGFSTSLHYVYVVSRNWNSSHWSVTMKK